MIPAKDRVRRESPLRRDKFKDRWNFGFNGEVPNEGVPLTSEDSVRISLLIVLVISVGVGEALAQTAAPPSAAPAPSPSSAAPAAPPTGAPALSPSPGVPNPTGVVAPRTPTINSTPSQSNVDLYPPSRLTNPGGPAGPPGAERVTPATPPQGQAPQGSGRPQPGGANTSAPAKEPKKTGADYSNLTECMNIWDAETHMTKGQWRGACARVQNRLKNLEATAEEAGTKKPESKRQSGMGGRRSAKAEPEKENAR